MVGGTDNGRQKTRNHGYIVIVGGELFTDYSDQPSQTCHAKPQNSNQQAPDATSFFPVGGMPTASQLGLKDFSPKSQDAVALQQIKERGALPMIDRGDIRQAIDRCGNIPASLPGAGYGQFEHKADSLIAKFKEAGGTVREIDVWAESPRLSPPGLLHHRLARQAVNHYRDNAITYKAQRDKNARELKLANAAITDMQMRQRDVAALDAKYTKELADAKAEMMLSRDDVAAGRRRLHISKQSVSHAWSWSPLPAWIMQYRLADTAESGLFHPQERGWSLCKNNWKEPRSILMSSADRVAHIDGQLMHYYCEQYTRASSGV